MIYHAVRSSAIFLLTRHPLCDRDSSRVVLHKVMLTSACLPYNTLNINVVRSIYSSLWKVKIGVHRKEETSKMLASLHTMGSGMERR